jgi:hypothetical protein
MFLHSNLTLRLLSPPALHQYKIIVIVLASVVFILSVASYNTLSTSIRTSPPSLSSENLAQAHVSEKPAISTLFLADANPKTHPVVALIRDAREKFKELVDGQSETLEQAVEKYHIRYGRPPPPRFDKWFELAKKKNSPIIDNYDSIEDLLRPFWGLPPSVIRARAALAPEDRSRRLMGLKIRDGMLANGGGEWTGWVYSELLSMMDPFRRHLPDMDLVLNMLDEPRMVLPAEQIAMLLANVPPRLQPEEIRVLQLKDEFSPIDVDSQRLELEKLKVIFNNFPKQATWSHSKMACPIESPARALYYELEGEQSLDPDSSRTQLGFVVNFTAAADVCANPAFQTMHGFFNGPDSFILMQNLMPIMSQSKISSFSDILFPNFWYFAKSQRGEDKLSGERVDWKDRKGAIYWRGSTTGGYATKGSWKNYHRQRLVDLVHGHGKEPIMMYEKDHDKDRWNLKNSTATLYQDLFDVEFTAVIQCEEAACEEQKKHFHIAEKEPLINARNKKFALDLDGNAFSGRYYALLKSNSVVFKQTIFREWHDERLIPWLHYVPLSMDGTEIFEILRYFTQEGETGDAAAKSIADASKEWMDKALRNDDMQVYLFRLLLEMARVMDENRDRIGFSMA